MKTRTVVIGVVILVVGIGLVVAGAYGALGSIAINRTFTQRQTGEYVSAEVILNTTSDLAISHPASTGGLVHAQDLSLVTSANIGTYAIPYNTSGAGSDIYRSLSGNFYYVAFSSSQPGTTIVATPVRSGATGYGALILVGIVLVIAGIVVSVIGVRQKGRPPIEGPT